MSETRLEIGQVKKAGTYNPQYAAIVLNGTPLTDHELREAAAFVECLRRGLWVDVQGHTVPDPDSCVAIRGPDGWENFQRPTLSEALDAALKGNTE